MISSTSRRSPRVTTNSRLLLIACSKQFSSLISFNQCKTYKTSCSSIATTSRSVKFCTFIEALSGAILEVLSAKCAVDGKELFSRQGFGSSPAKSLAFRFEDFITGAGMRNLRIPGQAAHWRFEKRSFIRRQVYFATSSLLDSPQKYRFDSKYG